ncbi:MAG: ABC transporter permease subunit [Streptosporangiales bacterium]|nr:ABC transporter permease subunit [Streptosporangiales bacterium]
MNRTRRVLRYLPMAFLFVVLFFLVVVPMGILLYATFVDTPPRPGAPPAKFTLDNYAQLLSPDNITALTNTLAVGVGGTVIAVVIGCVLAWLAARTNVPAKPLVQMAGIMPLFVSSLVGSIAWAVIASPRQGYVNILMRDLGLPEFVNIYSRPGLIFVFGLYYAPYVFLFVNSALTLLNPELEDAAQVHGANSWRVLRHVTLKLVTPALLGAATLTLMLIMENFTVPQVLGSPRGIQTIPTQIYRLMATSPSQPNVASVAGTVLLVITIAMVIIQRRLLATRQYVTVTGKGLHPRVRNLGPWRWVGFAFAVGYILLAVVLPIWALAQSALRPNPYTPNFASLFDLDQFNLDIMREALDSQSFQFGLINSILVGIGTALFGGALYLLLAYIVHRTDTPGRRYLQYIAMWPIAVPALVISLGFLWTWIRFPLVYGTLAVLILAYISRLMPQGFQGVSSSMIQVHKDLEESAFISGASRLRTVWEILLPLIRTGVASTLMLIFILSMRELSVAIFLFTSETQVLSIAIYSEWEGGRLPPVAAMSLLYVALMLVLTLIGRRFLGIRAG